MDFNNDLFKVEEKSPPSNFVSKTMKFIKNKQQEENDRKNSVASFQFNLQTVGKSIITVGVALFVFTFLPNDILDFSSSPRYKHITDEIQSFQSDSVNLAIEFKEKLYDNVNFIKE